MALHIHTCCNAMVRPFSSGPLCRGNRSSRRDSVRAAAVATAPPGTNPSAGPPQEIVRISPQLLEAGGLDPSTQDPQSIAGFSNMLDKVEQRPKAIAVSSMNLAAPVFQPIVALPRVMCSQHAQHQQ